MELTAHPLPAPRRLRLEAEQLLRERFFFHCRIMYPYVLCLRECTYFPYNIACNAKRKHDIQMERGDEEVKKALVIALFMLVMVIVSLLIARFQL